MSEVAVNVVWLMILMLRQQEIFQGSLFAMKEFIFKYNVIIFQGI